MRSTIRDSDNSITADAHVENIAFKAVPQSITRDTLKTKQDYVIMKRFQFSNIRVAAMTHDIKLKEILNSQVDDILINLEFVDYNCVLCEKFDVLFVDLNYDDEGFRNVLKEWTTPMIALTGKMSLNSTCFLNDSFFNTFLPITAIQDGFIHAIDFAIHQWKKNEEKEFNIAELKYKVGCRRFIVMAELQLIKWFGCSELNAWKMIRKIAMERQVKTEEISMDILSSPEVWQRIFKSQF